MSTRTRMICTVLVEDLRVGDWIGWPCNGTVIAIEPYDGPLRDIVFATARVTSGYHMSLCRGDIVSDVVRAPDREKRGVS